MIRNGVLDCAGEVKMTTKGKSNAGISIICTNFCPATQKAHL
jgi:hypothetical protein